MNRKKSFVYLGLAIVFLSVCGMAWQLQHKMEVRDKARHEVMKLPNFEFQDLTGAKFSKEQLVQDNKTVVMYFNPTCHLCEHQVGALQEQLRSKENINWILVTDEAQELVQEFIERFELADLGHVKVLLDKGNKFYSYFGFSTVPSTFIYDKELDLLKGFAGEVSLEILKDYL